MKTIATLFSGGGGFDLGAIAAGYLPVFGIDNNADAVDCYRKNIGDHIVLGDVRSHDYSGIKPDHLHASPSCKASSAANANRGETQFDIECAEAVCRAIAQMKPNTFSLENVEGYKTTESFSRILNKLLQQKYQVNWLVANSADWGVPQTRKRFIAMASKHKFPSSPVATHCLHPNNFQLDALGYEPLMPWVSWYEAIADLIPTLKESKLADWQIKALPDEIRDSFMLDCRTSQRAFSMTTRGRDDPGFTITGTQLKGMPKVLLIHPTDQRTMPIRDGSEPCFTVTTNKGGNHTKILLIENTGARSDRPLQHKTETEPCWTIRAMGQDSHWHKANVLERGKVYQINTRCLARLQSFPDSYILPERNSVAGMVIGNAVPPLLAQKIMEAF